MTNDSPPVAADGAPEAGKAFRAFNNDNEVERRAIAREMIDTEARRRFHDETYQYTQQPRLKFKSTPDTIADDLKHGIDGVTMYMSESKPGLLCIDIVATTIDHGLIEDQEMGLHPPKAENSTFVEVTLELYGRFSASSEQYHMAVGVQQHPMHQQPVPQ